MTDTAAIRGLMPAPPTAVTKDGKVDRTAMAAIVRHMMDGGATGVVPLGGTGEYAAFTGAERIAAVEATVDAVAGRGAVVAGVLAAGLGEAMATARDFRAAGADTVMVIPPYYARGSQQTVADYLRRVRDAAGTGIVLYDNPARSHVTLQPDTIGALAADGTIVGMKASGIDLYHYDNVLQRVGPGFRMMSGYDTIFVQQVAMGAVGGILGSAVLLPGFWNAVQAHVEAGRFAEALAMQRRLYPLIDALFAEENPGPTRAALEMIGLPNGPSILPIPPVSDALKARLFAALDALHKAGTLAIAPRRPA